MTQFGGEYHAPSAERELNGILSNLAAASEDSTPAYRVTILNTPIVNAFALPSGNIYVSRGLLALANDASEVAAVMAHEIAHVSARHAAARAERERQAAVITQAANVIQNRQKGEEVEQTQKLSFAGFSRQQEIDADRIGIAAIARAGYDPYGASRFLTSLGRSSALRAELLGRTTTAKPDILATHPSTPERIAKAVSVAREIGGPPPGRGDTTYLPSIDGLMFGDDPADGVVRGRRFLHARLGFAFTAPDGFALGEFEQGAARKPRQRHGSHASRQRGARGDLAARNLHQLGLDRWRCRLVARSGNRQRPARGLCCRTGGRVEFPHRGAARRRRNLSTDFRGPAAERRNRSTLSRGDRDVPQTGERRDRR